MEEAVVSDKCSVIGCLVKKQKQKRKSGVVRFVCA